MIAVDTNVLVYAIDVADLVKKKQAEQLIALLLQSPNRPILLWQVACEYLSRLRRWEALGEMTAATVDAYAHDVRRIMQLVLPTANVLYCACVLHAQCSLSHWDSLLVAAALEAGATTLYSEDLSHGGMCETLQVINPFKLSPTP